MIRDELGDGGRFGLRIDYCVDRQPLGTAAPLWLVEDWTEPALVMNGDLLTTIDVADVYRSHTAGGALLTVVFKEIELPVDYGVVRLAGDRVCGVWEKPRVVVPIATGVYAADPSVRDYLGPGSPADMPELIAAAAGSPRGVEGYRFAGEWYDIGTPASFERACQAFAARPDLYLCGKGGPPVREERDDGRTRLAVAEPESSTPA